MPKPQTPPQVQGVNLETVPPDLQPQEMPIDERFAALEERLNRAVRELDTSRTEVKALEQRIARLETELQQANERVKELSEKAERGKDDEKEDEKSKDVQRSASVGEQRSMKVAKAANMDVDDEPEKPAKPAKAAKKAKPAKATKVAKAGKRKSKGSRAATRKQQPAAAVAVRGGNGGSSRHPIKQAQAQAQAQGALLAVDVWDGKPSAVIGTGIPGDRRVRILQPGEQYKGVALVKADARRGSATFSTGTGVFTMFVGE